MAHFIVSDSGTINLVLGNKPYTITKSHVNYQRIRQNLKDDVLLATLVDVPRTVKTLSGGAVELKDDTVYYKGNALHTSLTKRIVDYSREGLPYDGMLLFLENLMKNPSSRAVKESFEFLEKAGLPITQRGTFIAYKAVRGDYYSKTAGSTKLVKGIVNAEGRIYNAVNQEIECERIDVDDDRNRTCSWGLHVGASEYSLGYFYSEGDHVVIVEVNPKDIVSVPADHSGAKCRVCAYKVIGEYTEVLTKPQYEVTYTNDTPTVKQSVPTPFTVKIGPPSQEDMNKMREAIQAEIDKTLNKRIHKPATYGKKPDGSNFYNKRGTNGRFSRN